MTAVADSRPCASTNAPDRFVDEMESAAYLRDVTHHYSSKDFVMFEEFYNLLWLFLPHGVE